ncbi:hypothetical protein D3C73_1623100 [compost metagenome]
MVYKATGSLNYGEYQIHAVTLNGSEVTLQRGSGSAIIPREELLSLQTEKCHLIEVTLA